MNNNKTRGISGLSILLCVLVLAGVYWFMSQSGVQQTAYTYQDFQKDLKKEKAEVTEDGTTVTLRLPDVRSGSFGAERP